MFQNIFCYIPLTDCLFSAYCIFEEGDVQGGEEIHVGVTDTEDDCATSARITNELATGATWDKASHICWAEYGDHISHSSDYRSCLFESMLLNRSNLNGRFFGFLELH